MATALLFSTNVKAVTVSVTSADGLYEALANGANGKVIELGDDITLSEVSAGHLFPITIYIPGDVDENGNLPKMTLNLKGHKITGNAEYMFNLVKGELDVISENAEHTGEAENDIDATTNVIENTYNGNSGIFQISGTMAKTQKYTKLVIGKGVLLNAERSTFYKTRGIMVYTQEKLDTISSTGGTPIKSYDGNYDIYATDVVEGAVGYGTGAHGFSFGVNIEIAGAIKALAYAVQISGVVHSPIKDNGKTYTIKNDRTNCYDATAYTIATADTAYCPYVHVASGAILKTHATSAQSTAIYAGGYGKWLIEGTVSGSTGAYIKSGEVIVNNATIQSTNDNDTGIRSGKSSGVDAGGNAIAIESNASYGGDVVVRIQGTSTIEAGENAYAIQDKLTTAAASELDNISISGGTIVGGTNGGAITIDDSASETAVELTGGTFTGDISSLVDHMEEESIIQQVVKEDPVTGQVTVVIERKTEDFTFEDDIEALSDDSAYVKLDAVSVDIEQEVTATTEHADAIKYLSILGNETYSSKVIVKSGATLKAQSIVMNDYGTIEVEAGGKLIVAGQNGIFADNSNNLIIHASEEAQGIFLLSPEVKANKQPNGQVEFISSGKQVGSNLFKWHRFTTPLVNMTSLKSDQSTAHHPIYGGGSSLTTYFQKWDKENNGWVRTLSSGLKPFEGFAISNTSADGNVQYTFIGKLQGSATNSLAFETYNWQFFGNSYTAPIKLAELIGNVPDGVSPFVYVHIPAENRYEGISEDDIDLEGTPDSIAVMQTFIYDTRLGSANADVDIDYTTAVWNYNMGITSTDAPARHMASSQNSDRVRIKVTAADGSIDRVTLRQSNDFSDSFDFGSDARKFMNEGINIYVASDENYQQFATDNLEGTLITLDTKSGINYTLSFDGIRGNEFALKDLTTGTIIEMNGANTYDFVATPNNSEARFMVVDAAKMPTAVETLEAAPAKKGIYTLIGQYMGEDFDILPKGIYIVNGIKIVK